MTATCALHGKLTRRLERRGRRVVAEYHCEQCGPEALPAYTYGFSGSLA